jgi:cytochrome c biogenesis protein CcmG/thiol:disulfide interchange protein DsbE
VRRIRPLALCTTVLVVCPSGAMHRDDPIHIVRAIGETYTNLNSYDFEGQAVMSAEIGGLQYHMVVSLGVAAGDSSDLPLSVQCRRPTWKGRSKVLKRGFTVEMPTTDFYDFALLPERVSAASIVRTETISANGHAVHCDVINAVLGSRTYSGKTGLPTSETLWVDTHTHLVLRVSFQTHSESARQLRWTTTFDTYSLNGRPPEWLLGARKTIQERLKTLSAKMEGMLAPEFSLRDIEGDEVSLNEFREQPVLLEFWATWCGPCKAEASVLASIERYGSVGGLRMLYISEEPADVLRDSSSRVGRQFSTLIDGHEVFSRYHVPAVPTLVLVGKTGRIEFYHVGFLSEPDLRECMKRAEVFTPDQIRP